ncbi:helix-turn-helix domain-containing protein [Cellulomonas chengniuliangii]|uniref:helix-turn-helix domain-containing protein n=1 Tax=Cellulomonas chengniuliangii TaxID=2968084 RepID=UPI001D0E00A8|nr:helix-turn-helix transcriptional regulator [Cellulomonas chengniuliangii]MCC2318881.1 helix-turn-helix transcriptional regulator [Cellulomonas chengniuliangii]
MLPEQRERATARGSRPQGLPVQPAAPAREAMPETDRAHRTLARAIAAQDWERAIEALDARPVELLCDHFSVVCDFFARVPAESLHGRPALALARAFLVGLPAADGAAPTEPIEPPTLRDRLVPALTQVISLRVSGRLEEAEAVAAQAQQLIPEPRYGGRHDDMLALVRFEWGILRLLRGDMLAAAEDFRVAARAARRSGIDALARGATGDLALVLALRGDLGAARELLDEADARPERGGRLEQLSRTGRIVARSLAALAELDVDAAAKALDGLDSIDDVRVREELWAFVEIARAQLAVVRGDTLAALHRLEAQVASHPATCGRGAYLRAVVGCAQVDLLLALGQGDRARAVLRDVPGTIAAMETARGTASAVRLRRARLELLTGDAAAARTRAVSLTHTSGVHPRYLLDALLIEAVAEHRVGDAAAALVALTRAVDLAGSQELVHPFVLVPSAELREIAATADVATAAPATARAMRWLEDLLDSPVLRAHGDALPSRIDVVDLSERERAVLVELASTPSLDLVAARLFVSPNTVKSQVRSLYRKLGVHSRDDALVVAYRTGVLVG